jgi:hypothetical protein
MSGFGEGGSLPWSGSLPMSGGGEDGVGGAELGDRGDGLDFLSITFSPGMGIDSMGGGGGTLSVLGFFASSDGRDFRKKRPLTSCFGLCSFFSSFRVGSLEPNDAGKPPLGGEEIVPLFSLAPEVSGARGGGGKGGGADNGISSMPFGTDLLDGFTDSNLSLLSLGGSAFSGSDILGLKPGSGGVTSLSASVTVTGLEIGPAIGGRGAPALSL